MVAQVDMAGQVVLVVEEFTAEELEVVVPIMEIMVDKE